VIASVKGEVAGRGPDHVVVECGGVGYRLSVSSQTLRKVPPVGNEVQLLAHLIARDDALQLYGFAADAERELFLKLLSVAGVGPKMALAVLSGSSPGELGKAIAAGDAKRFQVVPGVGKRTAERIIVELREKIPESLVAGLGDAGEPGDGRALAREGLVGLGYDLAEAEDMLRAVADDLEEASPEELISAALRTSVAGNGR
jgi:Holliday junction DNA helicase RuvA